VSAQDFRIRTPSGDMSYFGGLATLKAGVDGLAIDPPGEWLYFAAISHSGLFRVRIHDLLDQTMPPQDLANRVERFSDKPLSDGLIATPDGDIFITDVEHGAILAADPQRRLRTVIKSSGIRWADGMALGPQGMFYLADSALPDVILRSRGHISSQAPYYIFRFDPGYDANADRR